MISDFLSRYDILSFHQRLHPIFLNKDSAIVKMFHGLKKVSSGITFKFQLGNNSHKKGKTGDLVSTLSIVEGLRKALDQRAEFCLVAEQTG